jgi:hypothetical protein
MNKPQNRDIELPRIKRKINSWDGLVIDYLSKHPSGKAVTEMSMEAVTAYWLAETLEGKVNQEELTKACRSAIEKLEAKLVTIRMIGGIDRLPTSYLSSSVMTSNNMTNGEPQMGSHTENNLEDEEEDDDWDVEAELMGLPQTEEERDANRILGYGQ